MVSFVFKPFQQQVLVTGNSEIMMKMKKIVRKFLQFSGFLKPYPPVPVLIPY